tara:strand:- start:728 stop:865 length:138 start_codon:yes stop_codon:yes gene_type:complete
MNYVRTSSGSMMAINTKTITTTTNQQKKIARPNGKLKKDLKSYLK